MHREKNISIPSQVPDTRFSGKLERMNLSPVNFQCAVLISLFLGILRFPIGAITPSNSGKSAGSQRVIEQLRETKIPLERVVELLNANQFQHYSVDCRLSVATFLEHFNSSQSVQLIYDFSTNTVTRIIEFALPEDVSIRSFLKSISLRETDPLSIIRKISNTNSQFWTRPVAQAPKIYPFPEVREFFSANLQLEDEFLRSKGKSSKRKSSPLIFDQLLDKCFVYSTEPLFEIIESMRGLRSIEFSTKQDKHGNCVFAIVLSMLNLEKKGNQFKVVDLIFAITIGGSVACGASFYNFNMPKNKYLRAFMWKSFIELTLPYELSDPNLKKLLKFMMKHQKLQYSKYQSTEQLLLTEIQSPDIYEAFKIDRNLRTVKFERVSVEKLVQAINDTLSQPRRVQFTIEQIRNIFKNIPNYDLLPTSEDVLDFGKISNSLGSLGIGDYLNKKLSGIPKIWPVSNSDELADVVINALLSNYQRLDEIQKRRKALNF